MTILIKNGRVINPATGTDETLDVLVENGVVTRTGKSIKEKCDRVIDAKGCFVMPGFIDMHVHLRDPGFEQKETIETGARAAVHGGFTTILAMPNTKPAQQSKDRRRCQRAAGRCGDEGTAGKGAFQHRGHGESRNSCHQ